MRNVAHTAGVILLLLGCSPSEHGVAELTRREDRWVVSIEIAADSKAQYIGATRDLLVISSSEARVISVPGTLTVGDTIEGISIGAITCSFHHRDATYGGAQFMWRGRWACMAGRNREELETAVAADGRKRFAYIHVSPVTLPE